MKIGIYCRVSGLSQRENSSLESQSALGIDYIKRMGYDYQLFMDVESGGKLDRKEFSKLIKQCREGVIKGIWVYDNDRLSRDVEVGVDIRKIITKYSLRLFVGFEEVKLEESKDRFNYNIRSVMSDYERMRINERFDYGKKRAYLNGRGLGMLPFGYKKDREKKVIFDEDEKKLVIEVNKLYLRKDIKYMSEVGNRIVKKYGKIINGKRVSENLVGRILGNEAYLGKIYREDFEGNKYEFDIGRIIDDKTFERVKEKRGRMKGIRGGKRKIKYLLRNKVFCKDCGSVMWVKRGGKQLQNGKVYGYYYCNNEERKRKYFKKFDKYVIEENRFRKNRKVDLEEYERMYGKFGDCNCENHNTISIEKLEELVWKSLYDFIIKSDKIKTKYKLRYQNQLGESNKQKGKIHFYKKELNKNEERIDKLYDRWLDGLIDDDRKERKEKEYKLNIHNIKEKISSIESDVERFEVASNIDNYIDLMKRDLKKEFNVRRFEDKREVIEKYVDKIEIKYLGGNRNEKEYEITIKLFYDGGDDGEGIYKFNFNSLTNTIYKSISHLALTSTLTYKRKLVISMVYKYKIFNVGKNYNDKKRNKRQLHKIF